MIYICNKCGYQSSKWVGKCDDCGQWGTFQLNNSSNNASGSAILELSNINPEPPKRLCSGIDEINKVLGGGMVEGSAILLGGEPGIGKSTLLMQIAANFSDKCLYVSGEESCGQISIRAKRLGLSKSGFLLLETNVLENIMSIVDSKKHLKLIILDSIQTIYTNKLGNSATGTVNQVRSCASSLIEVSKKANTALILVGHVTKDGQIAGPKTLEHMVDAVLYFEGQSDYQFRILRSVKNRFGVSNESAILEMSNQGLLEVDNPSAFFLSENNNSFSGISIFAGMEGSRAILIEIQALISSTNMATPRRAVVGWDVNRLAMIVAVLNSRYGIFLSDKEIYLNVAGGIKVNDPAADLAVACALVSACTNRPLPKKTVVFGEIALSGEVRKVSNAESRIKEANRLGFNKFIIPDSKLVLQDSVSANRVSHIKDIKKFF